MCFLFVLVGVLVIVIDFLQSQRIDSIAILDDTMAGFAEHSYETIIHLDIDDN